MLGVVAALVAAAVFLLAAAVELASGQWLQGLTYVGLVGLALALFELTNFRKR